MPADKLMRDETMTWAVPVYERHLSLRVNRYSHVEAGHGWRASCALLSGRPVAGRGPDETFLRPREIELLIEALQEAKAQMEAWQTMT